MTQMEVQTAQDAVLEEIQATVDHQMRSVKVDKVLDPEFDLKDLLLFDSNPLMIDVKDAEALKALARDNAQLIINQIFGGSDLTQKGNFK